MAGPMAAIAAVCVVLLGVVQAELVPGPVFPFYDNCRRDAACSSKKLTLLPRKSSNGVTQWCFKLSIDTASCQRDLFTMKGKRVTGRCCNTPFAKIKFYVDGKCRPQFLGSQVTVPLAPAWNKLVAPTWGSSCPANLTSVKYTQFGPIPQEKLQGATFCLTLAEDGACDVRRLLGITNPANRAKKIFQAALYDRKTDEYECCPTYTFPA